MDGRFGTTILNLKNNTMAEKKDCDTCKYKYTEMEIEPCKLCVEDKSFPYWEAIPVPPVKDMEAEARYIVDQFYKTSSGNQQERLLSATLSAIKHCELMIKEQAEIEQMVGAGFKLDHYTQIINSIKNL